MGITPTVGGEGVKLTPLVCDRRTEDRNRRSDYREGGPDAKPHEPGRPHEPPHKGARHQVGRAPRKPPFKNASLMSAIRSRSERI